MLDEKETTKDAVITAYTKQLIQEFKKFYDPGQIPEVLENLKDLYNSNTEDNKDARSGIIEMLNHIRELCNSIVPEKKTAA